MQTSGLQTLEPLQSGMDGRVGLHSNLSIGIYVMSHFDSGLTLRNQTCFALGTTTSPGFVKCVNYFVKGVNVVVVKS